MFRDSKGRATQDVQCAVDSNVESRELEHQKWELLEAELDDNAEGCLQAIFENESCKNTIVTAIKMAMIGDANKTQQAVISVIDALLAYHTEIETQAYEILEAA